MIDYKVKKTPKGWIIKELWFKIFKHKVYKDLQLPTMVETGYGQFIKSYKPYFDSYETAILAYEFISEHNERRYRGFILEPIYEVYDGTINTDAKMYVLMSTSWCKIGNYLELTSIIDDIHGIDH